MSLPELTASIWQQRELLAELERRLVCEQLLLQGGRLDLVPWATEQVQETAEQLRMIDMGRAALCDAVACEAGLQVGATLAELADSVQQPWGTILLEHRQALIDQVTLVQTQAARNDHLLQVASGVIPEQRGMELVEQGATSVQ